MKVALFEGNLKNDESPFGWYFITDSAWTNAGKPFFFPENTDMVTVSLTPVIRINRLGKFIAEKFASRYYAEMAPGVHFRLPRLREALMSRGLSPDAALSFDRSLTVGSFFPVPKEEENILMTLKINGEEKIQFHISDLKTDINGIISEISKTNTIKTGDFLVPALCGFIPVQIGDCIEVTGSFIQPLKVKVK